MIKTTHHIVAFLLLAASWIGVGCTRQRGPCLTPKVAGLNLEFTHYLTDTSTVTKDTALPAAVFIAVTNAGEKEVIGGLYNSLFTISLSSVSDSCRWMVATDTLAHNKFDTLTFYYQRELQFLSNACGYTYFYNLDSVHTSHFNIDSVHITNASVTNNVNTKHIKIYIHPDTF